MVRWIGVEQPGRVVVLDRCELSPFIRRQRVDRRLDPPGDRKRRTLVAQPSDDIGIFGDEPCVPGLAAVDGRLFAQASVQRIRVEAEGVGRECVVDGFRAEYGHRVSYPISDGINHITWLQPPSTAESPMGRLAALWPGDPAMTAVVRTVAVAEDL